MAFQITVESVRVLCLFGLSDACAADVSCVLQPEGVCGEHHHRGGPPVLGAGGGREGGAGGGDVEAVRRAHHGGGLSCTAGLPPPAAQLSALFYDTLGRHLLWMMKINLTEVLQRCVLSWSRMVAEDLEYQHMATITCSGRLRV